MFHFSWIRKPLRRWMKWAAGSLLAGAVLLGAIMLSEKLLLPAWLEPAGRLAFRAAFLITLPFRMLVFQFLPPINHHYSMLHFMVTCLGTPLFYLAVALLGWRLFKAVACLKFRSQARHESVRQAARAEKPAGGVIVDRRTFLAQAGAGATLVASGGLGVYSTWYAPSQLKVRRYTVPIRGLPESLDGMRIIHVSDTHYGPYNALSQIEQAIATANSLRGDLVVLTGDYVHFTPSSVKTGIGVLSTLKAKYGAVAVMGNHEHWEGAAYCRRTFQRTGIPLLDNDRLFLNAGGLSDTPAAGSVCIAGLGDYWEDELEFDAALRGVPRDMARLVLSHNPVAAEYVGPGRRVDLMFSGHTHGGQVCVPGLPVVGLSKVERKYLGGLCTGPHCRLVVSRGVGMAGIPVRFRVYPEIGEIRLVRA
ncbi:MAG TPA: metallophosphoesterase [Candidatus Bathyarchaeia archaeon]|nr:metallophosphoesterase [Candidatus Bathyarchaeia archaeon]